MNTYYLYKKTHKQTGLKYLGFTKHDPNKYKGSGVYWLSHLAEHGYEVDTEIIFETSSKKVIKEKGLWYSQLWNIVESNEWANLKPEGGEGGGVPGQNKGKSRPKEHCDAMRSGWQRRRDAGLKINPWNTGLTGLKGPCKSTTFISPSGEYLTFESMKQGCKELNLIYTKMSAVKNGHASHHRGWKLVKSNPHCKIQ